LGFALSLLLVFPRFPSFKFKTMFPGLGKNFVLHLTLFCFV
jgi:hypothetical protein